MNGMEDLKDTTAIRQTYLGNRGLFIFLVILSAFGPLSTDLYLPALPTMSRYFQVPEALVNLTLILFFVFYSLATLVWGPLSDKYGRRPILLIGLTAYIAGSALCAVAGDIYQLIGFRVLQAVGAGVSSTNATAIVKDVYQGKARERKIAMVQAMVVVFPALAPVLGALLLQFISWRGVFVTQAIIGAITAAGALAYRETLLEKNTGTVLQALGRLGVVLKNPAFRTLLIIFSLINISFMAFISSSSYIYQNIFGLSSQAFSLYFALNASAMLIGPFIYIRLSARFRRFSIINTCFAVMIAGGLLVLTLGRITHWVFAISLLPATIAVTSMRAPSTFMMLEQQKGDAGTASSLMAASALVMGSLGMMIISLFDIRSLTLVVGGLNMLLGLVCGAFWLIATKRPLLSKVKEM
jgi:DHA1 family bicyclomycin/chloramphenicol resistance-like MFS transporter